MGEIRRNKVKIWVLYRKNTWDKEGHFAPACQRNTATVALSLVPCLSLQTPATLCCWATLATCFQFFILTALLAKLFLHFLLSPLHPQPQSTPSTLPQHGNLYLSYSVAKMTNAIASIITGALLFPLSSYLLLLYKNCYFLSISLLNVAWLMFLFSLHKWNKSNNSKF